MTLREQFIKHIESDASTAFEGKFKVSRKFVTKNYLDVHFLLVADKGYVYATITIDDELFEVNLGFIYNVNNMGVTTWRMLVNNFWYKFSYDEDKYNEVMIECFDCDITMLHNGKF